MKKAQLSLIYILLLMLIPLYLFSQRIAVFPYKVHSYNRKHVSMGKSIAELITTRLAFSSKLRVVPTSSLLKAMRRHGAYKNNISESRANRIIRNLRCRYIITGELIVNYDKIFMKSKLLKISGNRRIILSKSFFKATDFNTFNVVNLCEKTIKDLTNGIFSLKLNLGRKINRSSTYDIMLIIDSTANMRTEIKFVQNKIKDIYSRLMYINPDAKIRFSIVDYKNQFDIYRARIKNFTTNINVIDNYLRKIRAFGGDNTNTVDSSYALYYGLVKGNWISQNRIIYLITSGKPSRVPARYRFSNIIKKAKNMGISVNILGSSTLPVDAREYYDVMARYTGGRYHDILYKLTYYLKRKGKTSFIYKHHYLYKLKYKPTRRQWMYQKYFSNRNTLDITLGRMVPSIYKVKTFLLKEGFKITDASDLETKIIDTDIDYIITNSMKRKLERAFRRYYKILVMSSGIRFYIYVGNRRAVRFIRRKLRTGKYVYIGGHIKPSNSRIKFDFEPSSILFTNLRAYIARKIIQSPIDIGNYVQSFNTSGLFNNKLWFIRAKILQIRR